MRPELLVARLRRGLYVLYALILGLLCYGFWRFELVELPGEGCSPLAAFEPGDRLLVDVHPGQLALGAAVLFRGGGALRLGRIAEPPPSAPAETWRAFEAGELWIVGDRPAACPDEDSRRLGTLPRDAVAGRVVLAWPW